MTHPVTLAPIGGKRATGVLLALPGIDELVEVCSQREGADLLHLIVLHDGRAIGHGTLTAVDGAWGGVVPMNGRKWVVRGAVGAGTLEFCDPAGVAA